MASERFDIIITAKGAPQAAKQVAAIGSSAKGSLGAVNALKGALGALGAVAIGSGIASAVKNIANFEKQIASLQNVTRASDAEFRPLIDTIQELGATTSFSATEAAEGAEFLARAGFDLNETIGALPATLNLAEAESIGLGRAADIASNILSGFGLNADQTTRVTDVLARTSQGANTNVLQLGQAFSFVAPVAAGYGANIEDVSAALGVLGNAGVQATRGGTALRAIFNKLGAAGISLKKETGGLRGAFERLAKEGYGDVLKANELVGKRFGALLANLIKNRDEVEKLRVANENAAGTTARAAEKLRNTLSGSFKGLLSALEAIQLAFVKIDGSTPGLTSAVQALATALRALAGFIRRNQAAINSLIGVVLAFGAALGTVRFILPAVAAGLRLVAAAALANPFTAILFAASALIAIFTGLDDELQIFGVSVGEVKATFGAFLQVINAAVTGTLQTLGTVLSGLGTLISDAFSGLTGLDLSDTLANITGQLANAFAGVQDFFAKIPQNAQAAAVGIRTAFANLGPGITGTFTNIQTVASNAFTFLQNAASQAFTTIQGFLAGFNIDFIVTKVLQVGNVFVQVGSIAINAISGIFNALAPIGQALLSLAQSALTGFGAISTGATDGVRAVDLINGAFNFLLTVIANVIAAFATLAQVIQDIASVVSPVVSFVINAFNQLLQAIVAIANAIIGWINKIRTAAGASAIGEISAGLSEFTAKIPGANEALNRYADTFTKTRDAIKGAGDEATATAQKQDLAKAGAAGLAAAQAELARQQAEAAAKAKANANANNELKNAVQTAKPPIEELGNAAGGAADKVKKLGDNAKSGAGGVKKLGESAKESSSFIEDAFSSAFDKASDAIAEFVATGKLDIKSLTQSILKDITKMALNSVFKQVFGGGGGGGGIFGGGGGGGGGGIFGGLFGGGGGGGGILGGLFGFADGGSFTVGGTGGTDNNIMSINGRPVARVSRGEMVTVDPKGGGGGGGGRPIVINYNISTPDANSFRRSQGQIQANAAATIQRASRRNN